MPFKVETKHMQLGGLVVLGLIIVGFISSMLQSVELGKTTVYQNSATGTTHVYHGPDLYFSAPFVGTESTYKDETTVSFTKHEGDGNPMPIDIGFADTYEADLPLSARFSFPRDDEHIIATHKAFRSQRNLEASLYKKTTVDVAVGTATQFTAEEVFQGGLNSLKAAIEDQIKFGLYITERKQVTVNSDTKSKVESGEDKTKGGLTEQIVTVWKAVPKLNTDGHKLRMNNPFETYGITASQLTLELPVPEKRLSGLLVAKKESVAKKILSMQKQENAKEDIKTAKLEGQAARETAEQKRLIVADGEIIEQKKEVKLARLLAEREIVQQEKQATLAIINKKKELQIAKANEGIQKANARAALHQASAIKAKGLAEASVKHAMYKAVRMDILQLETNQAIAKYKYAALPNVKIAMPTTVMMGNGEGGSLESLTNLHIIDKIK